MNNMKLLLSALLLTLGNAALITADLARSSRSEFFIPENELNGINPNKFLLTDHRKAANLTFASADDIRIISQQHKLEKILTENAKIERPLKTVEERRAERLAYNTKLEKVTKVPTREEKLLFSTRLEPRKHYLISSL